MHHERYTSGRRSRVAIIVIGLALVTSTSASGACAGPSPGANFTCMQGYSDTLYRWRTGWLNVSVNQNELTIIPSGWATIAGSMVVDQLTFLGIYPGKTGNPAGYPGVLTIDGWGYGVWDSNYDQMPLPTKIDIALTIENWSKVRTSSLLKLKPLNVSSLICAREEDSALYHNPFANRGNNWMQRLADAKGVIKVTSSEERASSKSLFTCWKPSTKAVVTWFTNPSNPKKGRLCLSVTLNALNVCHVAWISILCTVVVLVPIIFLALHIRRKCIKCRKRAEEERENERKRLIEHRSLWQLGWRPTLTGSRSTAPRAQRCSKCGPTDRSDDCVQHSGDWSGYGIEYNGLVVMQFAWSCCQATQINSTCCKHDFC